jgi:hypothetical protein
MIRAVGWLFLVASADSAPGSDPLRAEDHPIIGREDTDEPFGCQPAIVRASARTDPAGRIPNAPENADVGRRIMGWSGTGSRG